MPLKSVGIIGAGPCGLAAARRLKEAGLEVTVFERRKQLGGLWFFERTTPTVRNISSLTAEVSLAHSCGSAVAQSHITSSAGDEAWKICVPPSACYESLMTNIITPMMRFEGVNYPPDTKRFVSHETVLQYLVNFSKSTGIEDLIRCNVVVRSISKTPEGLWKLQLDSIKAVSDRIERSEETFDGVVVCNGHYDTPHIPTIRGLEHWMSKWPQKIIHSREYRNNHQLKDKNVLVIGSGVSAFDLGKDIAFVANVVYQAIRPRLNDDRPVSEKSVEQFVWSTVPDNVVRKPEAVEFCDVRDAESIQEGKVLLSDGTYLTGIDYLVLCTGYLYSLPFIDISSFYENSEADPAGFQIITDGLQLHNLHMDMMYIPDPTLAFVGIPCNITTFYLFDLQASAIAALFSRQVPFPTRENMRSVYDRKKLLLSPEKQFHSFGFHKELLYIKEVARWVNTPGILSFARAYERIVLEAQENALGICRERLLTTTLFRGKTSQEIKELVESKTKALELELARLRTETPESNAKMGIDGR